MAFDLTGRSRIFHGDSRSEGKIVSLFEPSAEVIRKGKASKLTEFGKLVKLQEAENQIIVDYEVFARRPSDMDLLIPAIDVHQAKLGRVPRLVVDYVSRLASQPHVAHREFVILSLRCLRQLDSLISGQTLSAT